MAWTTMTTGEAFDREWDAVMPAYKAWKERRPQQRDAAMEALKTDPHAALIKRGHDLEKVYEVWKKMYQTWMNGTALQPVPWNQTKDFFVCSTFTSMNIFTGQCNDLPDWRTDAGRARDDKALATHRKFQESRKK